MSGDTCKIIELEGSSPRTIEDAVASALSQASESLRHFKWFEVTQIRGKVEQEAVAEWQIVLKLGFAVKSGNNEEPTGEKAAPEAAGRYRCTVCGYIYDPEKGDPDSGVAAGTAFEDLPDDWVCPECGVNKQQFVPVEDE